jgi:hypothetical protein
VSKGKLPITNLVIHNPGIVYSQSLSPTKLKQDPDALCSIISCNSLDANPLHTINLVHKFRTVIQFNTNSIDCVATPIRSLHTINLVHKFRTVMQFNMNSMECVASSPQGRITYHLHQNGTEKESIQEESTRPMRSLMSVILRKHGCQRMSHLQILAVFGSIAMSNTLGNTCHTLRNILSFCYNKPAVTETTYQWKKTLTPSC